MDELTLSMGPAKTLNAYHNANMYSIAGIPYYFRIVSFHLYSSVEKKRPTVKIIVTIIRDYICMTHILMTSYKNY